MNLQNQLDYLPSLLDGVNIVPTGIDANILKSEIMLECGLLTPLYSEPEVMKAAITQWFASRLWTFDHLLKIVQAEYSPIENYDRRSHWTKEIDSFKDVNEKQSGRDQRDLKESHSGADYRDISEKLSDSDSTERSVEGDLTTEQEVSAYNSSSYLDSQKSTVTDGQVITTETTYGKTTTTSDDIAYGKTVTTDDDITYGKTVTTDEDLDHNETYDEYTHGNIGVTTNQQMIEQELALLAEFNIYDWIAKQFCADLMLLVY